MEFRPRTIWSLLNAFTSAFKELDPVPQFKATANLGEFLEARLSQREIPALNGPRGRGKRSSPCLRSEHRGCAGSAKICIGDGARRPRPVGGAIPPMRSFFELGWDEFSVNWNADVKASFLFCKAAIENLFPRGAAIVLFPDCRAIRFQDHRIF
jgi:hypothetical protein